MQPLLYCKHEVVIVIVTVASDKLLLLYDTPYVAAIVDADDVGWMNVWGIIDTIN